jgi:hypothetical protein
MKALSAELSVLALALLLLLSDFDLGFWAKAAPLRPMQAMAMTASYELNIYGKLIFHRF